MRVYVENIEPVWRKYMLSVEIPDDTPADECEDVAMELVYESRYAVEWENTIDTIDGMDQEFSYQGPLVPREN